MSSSTRPSRFWEHLAAEHSATLASEGFGVIKRRQALRYFTWQWDWRRLRTSQQVRFLLRHSSIRSVVAAAVVPNSLSREAWAGVSWPLIDRFLYVFATRLLWYYAELHGNREVLSFGEPLLGSPFPVYLRGQLISQDLANGAMEMRTIRRALATGTDPRHIVEIGSGYGRTGYLMLSLYPEATYTIVDIEPARSISAWYLRTLFPTRDIRVIAPDELGQVTQPADLVVSISSLQEMLPLEVERYLIWIDTIASGGIVYLKQWHSWRNPIDNVTLRFDEYPVPSRWTVEWDGPAPVQTAFRERVWRVPIETIETSP